MSECESRASIGKVCLPVAMNSVATCFLAEETTHIRPWRPCLRCAARTFSGVNGTGRIRTPVASQIALVMAAGIVVAHGSPAPQDTSPGMLIMSTSARGASGKRRIG